MAKKKNKEEPEAIVVSVKPFNPALVQGSAKEFAEESDDDYRTLAITLYDKLNSIYASPHFNSKDEKREALIVLEKALREGVHPKQMVFKMQQLEERVEFKTKLYNVISDKFWERQFVKPVTYHEYDPKKFL